MDALETARAFIEAVEPAKLPVFDAFIVRAKRIHREDPLFALVESMGWTSFILTGAISYLSNLPESVRQAVGSDDLKAVLQQAVADAVREELGEKTRRVEAAEARVEQIVQALETSITIAAQRLEEAGSVSAQSANALGQNLGRFLDVLKQSEAALATLTHNANAARDQFAQERDKVVNAAAIKAGIIGGAITLAGMGAWQFIAHVLSK